MKPSEMLQTRPEVIWFNQEMEKRLERNDHKGHWEKVPIKKLLKGEIEELEQALDIKSNVVEECADIANYAMMIASNWEEINS